MIGPSVWMLIGSITFARAWSTTASRHSSSQFRKAAFATRLHPSTLASIDNATDATMTTQEYPKEMTEDERYIFDLNGYLIIRGVLTPKEIQEANKAIDNHAHEMVERSEGALRNAVEGTKFYGQGPGRKDLGRVLEWGEESSVFKSILAHPR